MSETIESASRKMFNWFVRESEMTKLFENTIVRDAVWGMCDLKFRKIFEEGLLVPEPEDDEVLNDEICDVSDKFYHVVDGLIWNDIYHEELAFTFAKYLNEIRNS